MGSRLVIRKQDPSVEALGVRTIYFPESIGEGPGDADLVIEGVPPLAPDESGDFLVEPAHELALDTIHTFAVVRLVVDLYRRSLRRIDSSRSIVWPWGSSPLRIQPRAGSRQGAWYFENGRLEFHSFPVGSDPGDLLHTCQSFDIVAHEAGHAVLDGLRPGYLTQGVDAKALHEGFGDLTALFALLDQADVCEAVVVESRGNLRSSGFFAAIAEQFGQVYAGKKFGLRNADNDTTLAQAGANNVHGRSQVITGGVYDLLVACLEGIRDPARFALAESLHGAGRRILDMTLRAFLGLPSSWPSLLDFVRALMENETPEVPRDVVRATFAARGLDPDGQEGPRPASGLGAHRGEEAVEADTVSACWTVDSPG